MSESERPANERRDPRRRRRRRPRRTGSGATTSGQPQQVQSPQATPPARQSDSPTKQAKPTQQDKPNQQAKPGGGRTRGARNGSKPGGSKPGGARSGGGKGATGKGSATKVGGGKTGGRQGGRAGQARPGGQRTPAGEPEGRSPAKQSAKKASGQPHRVTRSSRAGGPRPGRGTPRRGRGGQMRTYNETSAGGLVIDGLDAATRPDGSVDLSLLKVVLIGRLDRRRRLLWSMPKGHIEPGETRAQTAEREVAEETGVDATVLTPLGSIDYWFVSEGKRIHKTVHHHLLRYDGGELSDEDPEVTEVGWFDLLGLFDVLAYTDERRLARKAIELIPEWVARRHRGSER